ncbi:MAG: InlB B-repeat-containing protein, partial [Oscillibacter sp.]|nr:InlB B-repeat-containing protein [Oscillibacter sp.]
MNTLRRALSAVMAVCMALSLLALPAGAAEEDKRTVKLGFDTVEWVSLADVDFAGDQYFDANGDVLAQYANTKVALVSVTAEATEGAQFNVYSGAQIAVKFDSSVLRFNDPGDAASLIKSGGRNPTTMGVSASSDVAKANADGEVVLLFADTSGKTYTVQNGAVIGSVFFFLADESKKGDVSQVSFGDDAKIIYYTDENRVSHSHDIDAAAVGSVPAYDPSGPVVEKWTISFDANGGNGSMDAVEVVKGESATLPKCAFTNTTEFAGWKDADGNDYADEATLTPTANMTLTAQWKEPPAPVEKWTISFAPNGGNGSMDAVEVVKGESVKLPKCAFTNTTEFAGWKDADGNDYADEATVTPTANMTLTA